MSQTREIRQHTEQAPCRAILLPNEFVPDLSTWSFLSVMAFGAALQGLWAGKNPPPHSAFVILPVA